MATSHNAVDAHVQDEIACEVNDGLDFARIEDEDPALGSQEIRFGLSRRLEVGIPYTSFSDHCLICHLHCSGLCARIW
jgi:hypothetical protein